MGCSVHCESLFACPGLIIPLSTYSFGIDVGSHRSFQSTLGDQRSSSALSGWWGMHGGSSQAQACVNAVDGGIAIAITDRW